MIAGVFHEGSGLGDQLFRYITVRTLAEEKGYEFMMLGRRNFKGADFLNLAMGHPENYAVLDPLDNGVNFSTWKEKEVREPRDFPNDSIDIRSYDPEINFVEDNTVIDGSFEDSKYWHHNLPNISKWLAVEPLNVHENTCVLGFRGGEYATQPDLFLSKEYFSKAIEEIFARNEFATFEVHSDDPSLAKQHLTEGWGVHPQFNFIENEQISHSKHSNMALNWRSMRYAKYAIIPNSAFFILPRLLKHLEDPTAVTIAPRYWARRNTKGPWRPAAYYKEFTYI